MIIICPNPENNENCWISYETYASEDSVRYLDKKTKEWKDTICPACANKKINRLDNFLPTYRTNLKVGRIVRCIKPTLDLVKDKTYFITGFGYAHVLIREKYKTKSKNYLKKRFEVFIKPFGSKEPGKWWKIK